MPSFQFYLLYLLVVRPYLLFCMTESPSRAAFRFGNQCEGKRRATCTQEKEGRNECVISTVILHDVLSSLYPRLSLSFFFLKPDTIMTGADINQCYFRHRRYVGIGLMAPTRVPLENRNSIHWVGLCICRPSFSKRPFLPIYQERGHSSRPSDW